MISARPGFISTVDSPWLQSLRCFVPNLHPQVQCPQVSEGWAPAPGLNPGGVLDSRFLQVAALREELAAAEAAQQSLQRQLAGKAGEGQAQQAQLQALQQVLAKAEAAHTALQRQLTARLADQSSQGAELEALQQRLGAAQQAESRQRDQLQQQAATAAAAQAELATLQGELRALQGTHSALQEDARQHQAATQSREADVAQLRQQQAAIASEREAEARALQQQLESARAAAGTLQVHALRCAVMCLCRQLLQAALLSVPQVHCGVPSRRYLPTFVVHRLSRQGSSAAAAQHFMPRVTLMLQNSAWA